MEQKVGRITFGHAVGLDQYNVLYKAVEELVKISVQDNLLFGEFMIRVSENGRKIELLDEKGRDKAMKQKGDLRDPITGKRLKYLKGAIGVMGATADLKSVDRKGRESSNLSSPTKKRGRKQ